MKKNVLVFPCGSEIGLEIHRALCFSKDFELFGASSFDDHGKFIYKNYIPNISFVDDANFIDDINSVIDKYNIDFIFPAHDSVVLKLSQNSKKLHAKVISSPVETCEIARSKRKTYEKLKTIIKVPKLYSQDEELHFPIFLKPDVGQGSKGTMKAISKKELDFAIDHDKTLLALEFLPGDEYTVDCLTGNDGELLYAQARQRERVSNGISVNSLPVKNDDFKEIAKKINKAIKFKGVWFFQVKRDVYGVLTLLEIAPRVAGTMALSRMGGVNLPLLSLYLAENKNISVIHNNFDVEIDRALSNRYKLDINYDTVYVDFDDSIIFENKVNYLLIAYLYKMRNDKKKIILITKHILEVHKTLNHYGISEKLFDEIIHLKAQDNKCNYIKTKSAIFIDDSFSERLNVSNTLRIPVFDISEIIELV